MLGSLSSIMNSTPANPTADMMPQFSNNMQMLPGNNNMTFNMMPQNNGGYNNQGIPDYNNIMLNGGQDLYMESLPSMMVRAPRLKTSGSTVDNSRREKQRNLGILLF